MSKAAIMQPYIFPYLGYFQMVNAVDNFVFYDDVQYIKGGWINRNRILISNSAKYFTVPLIRATPNKLINEICIETNSKHYKNILKTIELTYKKAQCFSNVFPLIENVFNKPQNTISELAEYSIRMVCKYLEINTRFLVSSKDFFETKGLERTERLIQICEKLNANNYINPSGGKHLYSKQQFQQKEITLNFIDSKLPFYQQFGETFVPGLSIIDVLMHNNLEEVKKMLTQFTLS